MRLKQESRIIECPKLSALVWDLEDLVEPMLGRRIALDGAVSTPAFFLGYPFGDGPNFPVQRTELVFDLFSLQYEPG